jgi:hypothetical protein
MGAACRRRVGHARSGHIAAVTRRRRWTWAGVLVVAAVARLPLNTAVEGPKLLAPGIAGAR